jgi:hypothetical protein
MCVCANVCVCVCVCVCDLGHVPEGLDDDVEEAVVEACAVVHALDRLRARGAGD